MEKFKSFKEFYSLREETTTANIAPVEIPMNLYYRLPKNKNLMADLQIAKYNILENDDNYFVKYHENIKHFAEAYNEDLDLVDLPDDVLAVMEPSGMLGRMARSESAKHKCYEKYPNTINESSLSRLKNYYDNYECAMLSAFRGSNTKAENMALSRELKSKLESKGYSVTRIMGVYVENYKTPEAKEVNEVSYFVANHKNDSNFIKNIINFGKEYNQDSIFIWDLKKPYLYGTNNANFPGLDKKVYQGDMFFSKSGEFMSKVNGRPFTTISID